MKWIFSLFALLLFTGIGKAQIGLAWSEALSNSVQEENVGEKRYSAFNANQKPYKIYALEKAEIGNSSTTLVDNNMQAPLGIFCNLDLNLDQNLPFKLRFRLGEYHYTRQLEYEIDNFISRSNEIK